MGEPGSSGRWPRLEPLWPFIAAGVFAVAIALLHRELASYTYRGIMRTAAEVPPGRLVRALGFTALAYAVLPGYDAMALSYIGRPLPLQRTAFGSFISYAFSQMLGFPLLTGGSVRYRLWSSWGLSSAEIARAVSFVAFSFALGMVALSGMVLLAEPAVTARVLGLPVSALRPIGVLELALVGAYAAWSFVPRGPIRIGSWKLPAPSPLLVGSQLVIAALDWTLAGAALYVLLPPAHGLGFLTFLGVFLLAQFAGLLSHVPGGLGVVETIMIVVLKPYIGTPDLLAALIVYRAVYYLLPFVVAVLLLGLHELRPYAPRAFGVARSVGGWVPRLVPQVLSGAVFLTGAVLLISGATPGVPGRLDWLGDVLPLGVIELSHFLGSLAGVGLLVLAWALWHRLDAAYGFTVALLAVGIGASLLKGIDWEEASLLTVVLCAVLPARRYFYRKSAIGTEPLETGWLLAIVDGHRIRSEQRRVGAANDLDPIEILGGQVVEIERAARLVERHAVEQDLVVVAFAAAHEQRRHGAGAAVADQHRAGRRHQQVRQQRLLQPFEIVGGEDSCAGADLAGRRVGPGRGHDHGFANRRRSSARSAARPARTAALAVWNPASEASTRHGAGTGSASAKRPISSANPPATVAPLSAEHAHIRARQRASCGSTTSPTRSAAAACPETIRVKKTRRTETWERTAGRSQPPEAEECIGAPLGVSRAEERTPPGWPGFLTRGSSRRVASSQARTQC